jgi:phospholipid/cholesterol/gamma-HCH transport system permease protein
MSALGLAQTWHSIRGYFAVLGLAARRLHALSIAPVKSVFERQVYFTGIEALGATAAAGLLAGAIVVTQITSVAGDSEVIAHTLIFVIVREVGPLLAAVLISCRSGVAIAAEVGLMKLRGETAALKMMRIPAFDYLIVPRVAAVTVCTLALTIYFDAVAVVGGIAVSALYQDVSFLVQAGRFVDAIGIADAAIAGSKSLCFALSIAAIACHHGIDVTGSAKEIPIATARAVVRGLLAVLVIDAVFGWFQFVVC